MVYGNSFNKLIIASVPRTGSTFILRSILGLEQSGTTPKGYYKKRKPLGRPYVGMTHSLAEDIIENGWRGILTFRNPVECIISTKLHRYNRHHFDNCGVPSYIKPEECDIYAEDILGYEKIFDSWINVKNFPMLYVKYETMNKHFDEISSWFGRKINFPEWNPRGSNIKKEKKEDIEKIEKTYSRFIDKVNDTPEVMIRNV